MKLDPSFAAAFERTAHIVEKLPIHYGPYEEAQPLGPETVINVLWRRRGKRLRPHLVYWFGELVGLDPEMLNLYAWAAEAVHTATLLHDDVIDNADIRRGGPTANRLFDNTLPVLSGDFLIADVISKLQIQGHPTVVAAFGEMLRELCSGEFLQYRLKYQIPQSKKPYIEVSRMKTVSLFSWCALVGPMLSNHPIRKAVEEFIDYFGVLFQRTDDFLDVLGTDAKDRWRDLKEGKLNSVTWDLVSLDSNLRRETLRMFEDQKVAPELIQKFKNHPKLPWVLAQNRRELRELTRNAENVLARFPKCVTTDVIRQLMYLTVSRSKEPMSDR